MPEIPLGVQDTDKHKFGGIGGGFGSIIGGIGDFFGSQQLPEEGGEQQPFRWEQAEALPGFPEGGLQDYADWVAKQAELPDKTGYNPMTGDFNPEDFYRRFFTPGTPEADEDMPMDPNWKGVSETTWIRDTKPGPVDRPYWEDQRVGFEPEVEEEPAPVPMPPPPANSGAGDDGPNLPYGEVPYVYRRAGFQPEDWIDINENEFQNKNSYIRRASNIKDAAAQLQGYRSNTHMNDEMNSAP